MKMMSVVLLLAACGSAAETTPVDAPPAMPGEPAELAGITAAHNAARAQHGETPLTWDPVLATIAAAWVASCSDADGDGLEDHDPHRSVGYSSYVGENIYATTGTATGPDAVDAWISESQYYDYADNTCAAGKECGHYTQVVWAKTLKLGCAIYRCSALRYPDTIVCDYGPGGNDGSRPY
jgi:hypothetical protein